MIYDYVIDNFDKLFFRREVCVVFGIILDFFFLVGICSENMIVVDLF